MERGRQDSLPSAQPQLPSREPLGLRKPVTPDAQGHGWEAQKQGEGGQRLLPPVSPLFPAQCSDLTSGSSSTVDTWASGLCLHGAKWPEAQGSLWPRERKDRTMINPDTRVRRGAQDRRVTPPVSLTVWTGRTDSASQTHLWVSLLNSGAWAHLARSQTPAAVSRLHSGAIALDPEVPEP